MTTDLRKRFTYHKPEPGMPEQFKAMRDCIGDCAELIDSTVPDGREKATALTKLEEAMMWANAGLARTGTPET